MKLIVGLGNPGKEYEKTRHNIGFMVLDNYVKKLNLSFSNNKFDGTYIKANINGENVIFLKPQKFINLSGEVIIKFINYFKISRDDIFVINDDLDIECGKYKLKYKGSSGGHNGLKNIELMLGSNVYKRLKIGISNNKLIDTKDYVLGKFSSSESKELKELFLSLDNLVEDFIKLPQDKLFKKYNSKKNVKKEEIQYKKNVFMLLYNCKVV